jgi:hypothetical protein
MAHVQLTLEEYHALMRLVESERESEGAHEQAVEKKRTRKKTSSDRKMSSAMKQARKDAKKKNGDFRKGWNNSRMMKHAHALKRKM